MKKRAERRQKLALIKSKILKRERFRELREGGWWCHRDSYRLPTNVRKFVRGWVPLSKDEIEQKTRLAYRNEGKNRPGQPPGCGWGCPICDPAVGKRIKQRGIDRYELKQSIIDVNELYWKENFPWDFHDYDPYSGYDSYEYWDTDVEEFLARFCTCRSLRDWHWYLGCQGWCTYACAKERKLRRSYGT